MSKMGKSKENIRIGEREKEREREREKVDCNSGEVITNANRENDVN